MTDFKAIIFDFDGVIAESLDVKTRAFSDMYKPFGEEVQKKVVDFHEAHGGVSRYVKFRHYHKEYLGVHLDETEINEMAQEFSNRVFNEVANSDFVAYAFEFISQHHADYDMFISTGAPTEETKRIAEKKKIAHYFKEIFGSPEKKTQHIKRILNRNGYALSEVVFIGDATTDRDAARETGIEFIGRYTTNDEIKKEKYLIKDFKNFNEYLKSI